MGEELFLFPSKLYKFFLYLESLPSFMTCFIVYVSHLLYCKNAYIAMEAKKTSKNDVQNVECLCLGCSHIEEPREWLSK